MEFDGLVEAIDEGRIVRVSEEYARREGLPIVRKIYSPIRKEEFLELGRENKRDSEGGRRHLMEDFRRPLDWEKQKIVRDLISNFHWEIRRKRKGLGITRADLAKKMGESEETVKLLENGILPKSDFVLINKIQESLGIQLKKEGGVFNQDMRKLVEDHLVKIKDIRGAQEEKGKSDEDKSIYGSGIEILEEED